MYGRSLWRLLAVGALLGVAFLLGRGSGAPRVERTAADPVASGAAAAAPVVARGDLAQDEQATIELFRRAATAAATASRSRSCATAAARR